jgi:hypothetical protein
MGLHWEEVLPVPPVCFWAPALEVLHCESEIVVSTPGADGGAAIERECVCVYVCVCVQECERMSE